MAITVTRSPLPVFAPVSYLHSPLEMRVQAGVRSPIVRGGRALQAYRAKFAASSIPSTDAKVRGVIARYEEHVGMVGQKVIDVLSDSARDRGLLVSPFGLHHIATCVLKILSQSTDPNLPKDILLVTPGKENRFQWKETLKQMSFICDEDNLWQNGNVNIRHVPVRVLKRMSEEDLIELLAQYKLLLMDYDHHTNPDGINDANDELLRRVLVKGGWINNEYQVRPQSDGRFFLGMSKRVSEGAGKIYRNGKDLIHVESFSTLFEAGKLHVPQVRELVLSASGIMQKWSELAFQDRSASMLSLLEIAKQRLTRTPRTIIYVGTREEAKSLEKLLGSHDAFKNEVSVFLRSGSVKGYDLFKKGAKNILVLCRDDTEGVDEFLEKPAELVFFADVSTVNEAKKATQMVAHHLSPQSRVFLVDLVGMFSTHVELKVFHAMTYTFSADDTFAEMNTDLLSRHRRELHSRSRVFGDSDFNYYGVGVAAQLKDFFATTPVSTQKLALLLNRDETDITQLLLGRYLPGNTDFIDALSDDIESRKALLLKYAWAQDQRAQFSRLHPLPNALSSGELEILERTRLGFFYYFKGDFTALEEMTPDELKEYLISGKRITVQSAVGQRFNLGLAKLLAEDTEKGMQILSEKIEDPSIKFWSPETPEDFYKLSSEHLDTWFYSVYSFEQAGDLVEPKSFMVTYEKKGNRISALKISSPSDDIPVSRGRTKLFITKHSDGKYSLDFSIGTGNQDFVSAWKSVSSDDQSLLLAMRDEPSEHILPEAEVLKPTMEQLSNWYDTVYPPHNPMLRECVMVVEIAAMPRGNKLKVRFVADGSPLRRRSGRFFKVFRRADGSFEGVK